MMTGKERLLRIFEGKTVDRPALKLWGLEIGQKMLHPAYKPVYDLASEITDIMRGVNTKFDAILGADFEEIVSFDDQPLSNSNWVNRYTCIKLPGRTLRAIRRYSKIGEPGYTLEHPVKEPEDLEALMRVKYKPIPLDMTPYYKSVKEMDDRGIVLFNLEHAAYAIQRTMGPECFALMSVDAPELLKEAVAICAARIIDRVKDVFNTGVKPVFGWVGPEIAIPPLMRIAQFEELVFNMDKPICDLIHNSSGYAWVHCHGKVGLLLNRFADMGVDVLNPIEPPPLGDITLEDAVKKVGNRMGLEGNIEISSLLMGEPEEVKGLIYKSVSAGKKSQRFILCPSANYMGYVHPTSEYIDNLMIYLKYGLECLTSLS